ncbi:MAG: methyltransferase domain-containing protein [Anaerolineae bacterium]|nr:methyltransferase domain-containing protein [Thermoflexales bacterium]MDW8406412.1 methyltransferase domain-containing protein [Anaerolineae bacterium]
MTDHQPLREKPIPPDRYDEAYFLTACEGYEEFLQSEGEHLSRRLKQAFEFADVQPGMRVLDVGCGRGEIVRHVARLGAHSFGVDYAQAAVNLSRRIMEREQRAGVYGLAQSDAKHLPFCSNVFDRVLLFDVVEHLYPWELDACLQQVWRVLKPGGRLIVHTAPNRWYDLYAYPVVRQVRRLMGQGQHYPANPRALNVAVNTEVHVNEQDILRMRRTLKKNGFNQVKVWLDTPPQRRTEGALMSLLRHIAFNWIPFAWFFEREVFAIGAKPG